MIMGTYYAFTTLSTVGFGDLAPRSDPERIFCALILLVGVGTFSVFLGDFTQILEKYKAIEQEIDASEQLDSFFNTMKHFNTDVDLPLDIRNKIRALFAYRWEKDLG